MNWLSKLLKKNKKRLGLQLDGDTLSYCLLNPLSTTPFIELSGQLALTEEALKTDFKSSLAKLDVKGSDAYWILASEHYRIMTLDKPNVPSNEMDDAIRWQVKDHIDVPINEAVLTHFDYPEALPSKNKINVVVARRDAVESIIKLSELVDINLIAIDIAELAMGNLMTPWLQEGQSIALIAESLRGVVVNCYIGHQFSFTRELPGVFLPRDKSEDELSLDENIEQDSNDQLLLEIQRTLDYYESQISKRAVTKVVIPNVGSQLEELETALKRDLGLAVELLNLESLYQWQPPIIETELIRNLSVCGGALRELGGAHAAN
ncbi:hypothetical protein [Pleionea sediminis]|uniref:hypothetical protein n=1 Tax=Pleionea sediminis TaxID=2569479 RepID=UPI001186BA4F|nr:hypothetical protein [Pleionea sediminis]